MKEEGISNNVVGIICRKLHRSCDILEKKNWDKSLTGEPLYLTDVEMVYLLFELEEHYGKRVDSKDLDNYGFCTINNIVSILETPN